MNPSNSYSGIALMSLTMLIFSAQDGISRYLAEIYPPQFVIMIRYWFYGAVVLLITARGKGPIRKQIKSQNPALQIFRALLLVFEIYVVIFAFVLLGLINTHVIFASYPLIIALLAGPLLGEKVGWRRRVAIFIGFLGVLIILQPGSSVFSVKALIPLGGAFMFAIYGLATRYVANFDSAMTSFYWTGLVGCLGATALGIWFWTPIQTHDLGWFLMLCVSGVLSHYLLIRSYELAEAGILQPFAYLQLVFVSIIGIYIFNEKLSLSLIVGGIIIISAGLFTFWRARRTRL